MLFPAEYYILHLSSISRLIFEHYHTTSIYVDPKVDIADPLGTLEVSQDKITTLLVTSEAEA